MAIALNDAHRELAEVARSFLAGQKARDAARLLLDAADEELPPFWPAMAGLGWLGLHVPEEYGGSGFGLPELAVVLEELGRAVIYGSVMGSFCCEKFGVDRFRTLKREDIDARFREFREFTEF